VGAWAGALVGAILVIAGVAKLTSRGWPSQARAIGVPPWAVRVVPILEVAIGAALVAGLPYAGWAAIALLVGFTVFLVLALLRGVEAPCACFGSMSSRPVTWWSVVRNVVLVALAAVSLR
jgi:uncharacterized membrane protein YphA (DoxX/SURF4 family)